MAPKLAAPAPDDFERAFRWSVVCFVRTLEASGVSRAEAVAAAAAAEHLRLDGSLDEVSESTVYRYLRLFEEGGYVALAPKRRSRVATSTVLDEAFLDFLAKEMPEDPEASIPEMIARAVKREILTSAESVDRSTVYRAAKRMGLPVGRRGKVTGTGNAIEQRRYAYPHRMQMVLCDGKHFRVGPRELRRVALIFIDDATRMALHAVVGTSESSSLFLRGLYELTCKVGLADIYYMDHGPGFIALDTKDVIAGLERLLIHGRKRYPEGRGKIERFNRTLKADVLRSWGKRTTIDPSCAALELRLRHYLDRVYNIRSHSSLSGRSPAEVFAGDERALELPVEDPEALRLRFVVYLERTVSRDHVISVDRTDYELPVGYARQTIRVFRSVLDGWLAILHEGRLLRIHPVDLAHNARTRRGRRSPAEQSPPPASTSAADMAFEHDFGPILDPDGGCPRDDDEDINDTPFHEER